MTLSQCKWDKAEGHFHDKSAFMNVSYNVTIGVGSISISTNSTNIAVMSGNYTVEDLY